MAVSKKKKKDKKKVPTRRELKAKAVEYKGGKCTNCGYNRCLAALTFHHIDPEKKDFGISRLLKIASWKEIKRELSKCQILCTNCHSEHHDGYIGPIV